MKKFIFAFIGILPCFTFAQDRSVDERCSGYAETINKFLVNRYDKETLGEQLELVNEIDDKEYRDNLSNMLRYIYTLPIQSTEKDIKIQYLNQYIASYRMCIKLYIDR